MEGLKILAEEERWSFLKRTEKITKQEKNRMENNERAFKQIKSRE